MTARCHQHDHTGRRSPICVLAAEVSLLVAPWQLATTIGREFELWPGSAHSCENERTGEGDEEATSKCPAAAQKDSLTRQEFAEERDNNVYGRCLRPALYSSLRSSPSHPTGVSALRVTIAIANARKLWGLRGSTATSPRHFRNESAASRRVRACAIGETSAMTRTAFCRKSPRVPRVCWLAGWALGTSGRENTATTERWRDKRPQCAARSVGCCCFPFFPIWQCAALVRNVRLTLNALQAFDLSHIAEAGHD